MSNEMEMNFKFQPSVSNIKTVNDSLLLLEANILLASIKEQLKGHHEIYTLYQKNDEVYGLIYADFLESDGIHIDSMEDIIEKDGRILYQALKNSKVALDYFFVVPYYDYLDRSKGSICFNTSSVITKDYD